MSEEQAPVEDWSREERTDALIKAFEAALLADGITLDALLLSGPVPKDEHNLWNEAMPLIKRQQRLQRALTDNELSYDELTRED
jgi:hypothetical protein